MLSCSAPALDRTGIGRWPRWSKRRGTWGLHTRTSSGGDDSPGGDKPASPTPDPSAVDPDADSADSPPKGGAPVANDGPAVADDFAKNRHAPRAEILGRMGRKPKGDGDPNAPPDSPMT